MSDSQTVPAERLRIFSRQGIPLAEFKAVVSRSWVIGEEGRAQFTYPTRQTDVANEDVLKPGNWLLVQNSVLPSWIGVLDFPVDWSSKTVTVSAYTPERVFSWRIGPLEEIVTDSPGALFQRLINRVNLAEQTVLRTASIWKGGRQTQMTLNPEPLDKYLKDLWETSGEDYSWIPNVSSDGRLTVHGAWVPFLGAETGVLLHEGRGGGNIEAVSKMLTEDGPIVNSVLAYGEGETWKSKPNTTVTDTASISKYGLREASAEYQGANSVTVLQANGSQYLTEFSQPARSFSLNALNVGNTFKYIRLGNILNVQFQNAGFRSGNIGFTSRVRIIGMSYNPSVRNKVTLVAREVV